MNCMLALQALKDMSAVGVPLYITETGVADERDVLRKEMMTTYFQQVVYSAQNLSNNSLGLQHRNDSEFVKSLKSSGMIRYIWS